MLHAFLFALGITDGNSWTYLLWSGFVGAVEGVGVLGGLITIYRKHTCHDDKCWRLARHPVAEGQFQVCGHHYRRVVGLAERHLIDWRHIAEVHRSTVTGSASLVPVDLPEPSPEARK